jgi:chromosome partitioning protein
MQNGINESHPMKSYLKWANRVPKVFNETVLKKNQEKDITIEEDENCLALLKHYHSLTVWSWKKRTPIFFTKTSRWCHRGTS